ncbi:hypothetical protein BDY24DRAFT_397279 [Mrakia frigida]|uniref:uncharacterized protein n=1 Tax=Mrakia frigida TaxID=29902 RepID=UPI003FCBF330
MKKACRGQWRREETRLTSPLSSRTNSRQQSSRSNASRCSRSLDIEAEAELRRESEEVRSVEVLERLTLVMTDEGCWSVVLYHDAERIGVFPFHSLQRSVAVNLELHLICLLVYGLDHLQHLAPEPFLRLKEYYTHELSVPSLDGLRELEVIERAVLDLVEDFLRVGDFLGREKSKTGREKLRDHARSRRWWTLRADREKGRGEGEERKWRARQLRGICTATARIGLAVAMEKRR